jgi:hypothetical protein
MAQNNSLKSNLDERLSEIFKSVESERGEISIPPMENRITMPTQMNENTIQPLGLGGAGNGFDTEPMRLGEGMRLDNPMPSPFIANNVTPINEKDELALAGEVIPVQPAAKVIQVQPAAVVPVQPAAVVPTQPAAVVPATPATVVPAQPAISTSNAGVVLSSDIKVAVSKNPLEGNGLSNNNNNLVLKLQVVKGEGTSNSIPLEAIFPFLNNNKIQTPKDLERLLSMPGVINIKGEGFEAKNVQLEFQNGKPFVKFDAVPKVSTNVNLNVNFENTTKEGGTPSEAPIIGTTTIKGNVDFALNGPNAGFKGGSIEAGYNSGNGFNGNAKVTASSAAEKPTAITEAYISLPSFYLNPEAKEKFLGIRENKINTQPQIKQR